jgi:D-alanyl-D-alanine carboxypeptidase
LLSHTSGYAPYDQAFMRQLAQEPLRERDHAERLEPLFRNRPLAAPGERFAYSDLNYVLLATLMEAVTKEPAYAEIDRRFVSTLALRNTAPSTSPRIPGLVPGYAGAANAFGGDKMLREGALVLNPQFEWAGGGYVSTASDLAVWMAAFCSGKAFPPGLWPEVAAGVPAPTLGSGARYGLGIVMQPTRAGMSYGHGGFFPGYVSWVRSYPQVGLTLAVQVNSSDDAAFKRSVRDLLDDAAESFAGRDP